MTQITASYADHMGNDLSVVRAARVSFANGPEVGEVVTEYGLDEDGHWEMDVTVPSQRDQKLIAYLAKHNHWTPFAHTSITLRVSAPVPIRTQCFKHKQGFVENEESRRYIKSTPELYVPEVWRKAPPEGGAKQGSSDETVDFDPRTTGICNSRREAQTVLDVYDRCLALYEGLIEAGVCPEQARFVLPQGCMVHWYWTGSLAAYARFYQQRTDPHAQKEIRDLARVIGGIIEPLYPVAWKELTK
jgi:thymidylate synthase (FAD)